MLKARSKGFILFLAFCLVFDVVGITASIATTDSGKDELEVVHTSEPNELERPTSIENPQFEHFTIPGWEIRDPGGNPYITDEEQYVGDKSLKFIAKDGSNTDVRTESLEATGGETYKVKAHVFMEEMVSHSFGWYILSFDENYNQLDSVSNLFSAENFSEGEWTEIEHSATLPEDTEYIVIRMYTGNPTTMEAYVDNVRLSKVVDADEENIEIPNDDFSETVSIDGWETVGDGVSISGSETFGDGYSLVLNNVENEQIGIYSNEVSVEDEEIYYATARLKMMNESHAVQLGVHYYDEADHAIGEETMSYTPEEGEVDQWVEIELETEMPENTKYAVVSLSSNGTESVHAYIDRVFISPEQPDDEIPQFPSELKNADFEEPLNEDGSIPGWTKGEIAPDSTIEVSDDVSFSGDQSLYFHDNDSDLSLRIQSDEVAVEPGETYVAQAEAWIVYQSHNIVFEIDFYRHDGSHLATETSMFNNQPLETWTTLPNMATAPEGAAYARVSFYSGGISITEAYFDDVSFNRIDTEEELELNLSDPESLGEMVEVPLTQGGKIGTTAEGNNEVYLVANGNPAVFHAVDGETGELKFDQPMRQGDNSAWAMAVAPDGDVYYAGDGTGVLYRYIPDQQEVVEIPGIPSEDRKIWSLTATDDGVIYGGTYPGAEVWEYDIETEEFKNFGRVHPDEQYARGITATAEHIYVTTGSRKHVIQIDRETEEKEELVITNDIDENHQSGEEGFFSAAWVMNDRLLIQSGSSYILVVNPETLEVEKQFRANDRISSPSPHNSNIIYYKWEQDLYQYDFESNTESKIEGIPNLPDTPRIKHFEWITLNGGEKQGETVLAGVSQYSEYFLYDPQDDWFKVISTDVDAQPVNIQSMERSPDNKLYIGGFQRGLTIFDIETETIDQTIGTFRQAEGIGFKGDAAYFGTYTGAEIYRYDPDESTDFGPTPEHNPGFVYKMPDQQDRPFTVTSSADNDYVFVGSAPDYGVLGGSLAIYDVEADEWESHRNVVEKQSIIGLEYKDGVLYGGTSIWGGQGDSPEKDEAKIFLWDVESGEKIDAFTPDIPNIDQTPRMIGELSFGPDGLLWGAVDGTIFAMDVETREVVKSKVILPSTYSSSKWRPHYLRWGDDGLLYTTLSRTVVVIDPNTLEHKIFDDLGRVHNMTLGEDGTIYYAQDTTLYKMENLDYEPPVVSIESIQQFIDEYGNSGEIQTPLLAQLTNRLDQAKHHKGNERMDQAIKHMEKVFDQLNNESMDKFISNNAKESLNHEVTEWLEHWSEE